jgi:hypothetical protein
MDMAANSKLGRAAARLALLGVLGAGALALGGCAATQLALAHKDLDVQSYTDGVLLLPMSSDKTYALSVRNSTIMPLDEAKIEAGIEQGMRAKGYTEVAPEKAHFVVQLFTYSATTDAAAAGTSNRAALAGAAAGGINGNAQAALIGALLSGVGDAVAGGLVKDVTVDMNSEIQVGVRQAHAVQTAQNATLQQGSSTVETQHTSSVSDLINYRVRVITSVDQVNLHLRDAIPQMQSGLVRNVVGLF